MAKKLVSVQDYEELTLSTGEVVKVHRVPSQVIRGVVPDRPRPKRPAVEMVLAGGKKQMRPAKDGDVGWDEYQEELTAWEEERDQLQEDITLCWAFKSYPYPAELVFPLEMQELIDDGLIKVPENKYGRKALWLHSTVLAAMTDDLEVDMALQRLSGVPKEVVQQIKDNFLSAIRGQGPVTVGDGAKSANAGEPEGDDDVQ